MRKLAILLLPTVFLVVPHADAGRVSKRKMETSISSQRKAAAKLWAGKSRDVSVELGRSGNEVTTTVRLETADNRSGTLRVRGHHSKVFVGDALEMSSSAFGNEVFFEKSYTGNKVRQRSTIPSKQIAATNIELGGDRFGRAHRIRISPEGDGAVAVHRQVQERDRWHTLESMTGDGTDSGTTYSKPGIVKRALSRSQWGDKTRRGLKMATLLTAGAITLVGAQAVASRVTDFHPQEKVQIAANSPLRDLGATKMVLEQQFYHLNIFSPTVNYRVVLLDDAGNQVGRSYELGMHERDQRFSRIEPQADGSLQFRQDEISVSGVPYSIDVTRVPGNGNAWRTVTQSAQPDILAPGARVGTSFGTP